MKNRNKRGGPRRPARGGWLTAEEQARLDPRTLVALTADDHGEEFDESLLPEIDPDVALLTDYQTGALSAAERARVEERLERDAAFREVERRLAFIRENATSPAGREITDQDVRDVWNGFREKAGLEPEPPAGQPRVRPVQPAKDRVRWLARGPRVALALAATVMVTVLGGLALALGSYPPLQVVPEVLLGRIVERAPGNERHTVEIPGVATYTLEGRGSWISYGRHLDERTVRRFHLRGAGTFSVVHRDGFTTTVHAGQADVTVTGTRFRIDALDEDRVLVDVLEGTVEVRTRYLGGPLVLHAGEHARVESGRKPEKY